MRSTNPRSSERSEASRQLSSRDKDLVNLHSLLQIIVEYITEARLWNTDKTHLAKENISLMSRTNFSSMFQQLLRPDEQDLFKAIVKSDAVLNELGVTRKTLVFPSGFVGRKSPGPTIYNWLVSIYKQDRDLLSSLGGDNRAMGRFPVETEKGKKDTNLVKFEARATSGYTQVRPVVEWVDFAEEVFKAAHTKRPRTGSTELIYEPKKCPDALAYKGGFHFRHGPTLRLGAEFGPDPTRFVASSEYQAVLDWAGGGLTAGLHIDVPMNSQEAFIRAGLRGGAEFRVLNSLYAQLSAGGFIESAGGGLGYELGGGLRYDSGPAQFGVLYNFLRSDPQLERHQLLVEMGFRW